MPPSVTFRLIAYLVTAQLVAIVIGWPVYLGLALSGHWPSPLKIDSLAFERTRDLLIASILRGNDGALRIEPSAALREEMKRVPSLKLAAYDPSQQMIVRGSADELKPLFVDPPTISLVGVSFFLVDDKERLVKGSVSTKSTAFGELRMAIYGERFRWDDPLLLIADQFTFYSPYIIVGILLSSAGTWLAVRRGLAPLRRVTDHAAKIDVDKLDQRLSERGVPVEILPLVGGFNDALARLDAGVGRLRRFTANAAHELRTPVATLEARLDNFDLPTIKNDLRSDARRIRAIVEQLLATTRMSRSDRPKAAPVDLVKICQAVADDFALLAIRQGKGVEFEANADRLETLGDADALQSVIANLVENALRAEPQRGTVILSVSSDGVIKVVDHGPGVTEPDREMIFEPFWRKSEATPGAGLGLAIAKELTEALGGRIWVEETPGGGATFKLSFPKLASGDSPVTEVVVNTQGPR